MGTCFSLQSCLMMKISIYNTGYITTTYHAHAQDLILIPHTMRGSKCKGHICCGGRAKMPIGYIMVGRFRQDRYFMLVSIFEIYTPAMSPIIHDSWTYRRGRQLFLSHVKLFPSIGPQSSSTQHFPATRTFFQRHAFLDSRRRAAEIFFAKSFSPR